MEKVEPFSTASEHIVNTDCEDLTRGARLIYVAYLSEP